MSAATARRGTASGPTASDSTAPADGAPARPVCADRYLLLLAWVSMLSMLWVVNADPDLWGHLRFGADLLRDRSLPVSDPYSFTSDLPWVNHEWLAEAVMAAAYQAGGSMGVVAIKLIATGTLIGVLTVRLRPLPAVVQCLAIVITMWAAVPVLTTVRPQIFSIFFTAVVAFLLTGERPSARLAWIPVIFAVWTNAHGGWLVGLWLVGCWCLFALLDAPRRAWAVGLGAATLVATLVNPYGHELWLFLYRTVGLARDIREWQPLTAAPFIDWCPWIATLVAVMSVAVTGRLRPYSRLLTLAVMAYASFRVVRLIPFFALVSAVYLAEPLALLLGARVERWRLSAPSRGAARLMLIPTLAVVVMTAPSLIANGNCVPVQGFWVPDARTAMALQLARPRGRMVTTFGWGQYVIWHFGPGLRVSLDGRRETVYSAKWIDELWEMEVGWPRSFPLLERLRPDYVWLPAKDTALERRWLETHGYRIDVDSGAAWIAVRRDLPALQPATADAPACFPG
jgi:hypothetical protein